MTISSDYLEHSFDFSLQKSLIRGKSAPPVTADLLPFVFGVFPWASRLAFYWHHSAGWLLVNCHVKWEIELHQSHTNASEFEPGSILFDARNNIKPTSWPMCPVASTSMAGWRAGAGWSYGWDGACNHAGLVSVSHELQISSQPRTSVLSAPSSWNTLLVTSEELIPSFHLGIS